MKKRILTIVIMIFTAAMLSAGGSKEAPGPGSGEGGDERVKVFVSILPQQYFVEKIGGDRVESEVLVAPGRNPATYEPTPSQVASLGGADVLLTIGVPFENAFLPAVKGSLKKLKIVDVSSGIEKHSIDAHEHEEDEHAGEGEPDPHVWLSPVLAKTLAQNIHAALVEMDPEGIAVYDEGLRVLSEELEALHGQISAELAPFAGNTLFIYHPALGYFADEYGLKQVAIEVGGKEPSPAALAEIIEHAKEEDVRIIFVQPEFSEQSAAVIAAAIGGNVVGLNTLSPDYSSNLLKISEAVRKSYE